MIQLSPILTVVACLWLVWLLVVLIDLCHMWLPEVLIKTRAWPPARHMHHIDSWLERLLLLSVFAVLAMPIRVGRFWQLSQYLNLATELLLLYFVAETVQSLHTSRGTTAVCETLLLSGAVVLTFQQLFGF